MEWTRSSPILDPAVKEVELFDVADEKGYSANPANGANFKAIERQFLHEITGKKLLEHFTADGFLPFARSGGASGHYCATGPISAVRCFVGFLPDNLMDHSSHFG
jgi:hypothetical protein